MPIKVIDAAIEVEQGFGFYRCLGAHLHDKPENGFDVGKRLFRFLGYELVIAAF